MVSSGSLARLAPLKRSTHLVARTVTDETLRVRESDARRRRAVSLVLRVRGGSARKVVIGAGWTHVGDNLYAVILPDADTRVGPACGGLPGVEVGIRGRWPSGSSGRAATSLRGQGGEGKRVRWSVLCS